MTLDVDNLQVALVGFFEGAKRCSSVQTGSLAAVWCEKAAEARSVLVESPK